MSDSVHNENLLVRYLDGDLTAEEKATVEQRLQTDETFREQYRSLQVAVQAVRHLGTLQQVESIHREMMKELKSKKLGGTVFNLSKTIRYTMAVAASVLVLFIGVRLYLSAQLSPGRIYNETFVDFNVSGSRTAGEQLSGIETLYQKKEYRAVTTTGRSLHLSAKDSLLIGLSYLHTKNYPAAVNWFGTLASTQNDYRQDAEFYLSLSYLKTENYAKALSFMESIHNNPAHLYQQQVSADAIEKLKKLNEK
jgi:hypothetical protein